MKRRTRRNGTTCQVGRAEAAAMKEYVRSHGFDPTTLHCAEHTSPGKVKVLGQIRWIEYTTKKKFEGDETFIFHHDFELDKKPWLAYGQGSWVVLGGGYTVTPHGIEDDPDDERDLLDVARFRADLGFPTSVTGMGVMFAVGYHDGRKVRTVRFHHQAEPPILAYNQAGQPKSLYVVPVARAQKVRLP